MTMPTDMEIASKVRNIKNKLISTLSRASPKSKNKNKWTSPPRSALLCLPGELRNQIYSYVLVRTRDEDEDVTPSRIELCTLKRPALAATCRQIQHEALSYFFRHESFSYTFVLDGHARLSYKLDPRTKRWLKAARVQNLTIYDLVFSAQLPDVDGPYDANDVPLRSDRLDLIVVKDATLEVVEHPRDDDESIESASTLARREKLLVRMEKVAECGVDVHGAQQIADLILKVGGFRFRVMLFYIRALCLVRDKVSRRLAEIMALAPII